VNSGKTLFAQLMDFLPWSTFTRIVSRYGGDWRVRTLSCAEQYRAMAFAQLTYRESLRDIETCLSAQAAKLYAMKTHQDLDVVALLWVATKDFRPLRPGFPDIAPVPFFLTRIKCASQAEGQYRAADGRLARWFCRRQQRQFLPWRSGPARAGHWSCPKTTRPVGSIAPKTGRLPARRISMLQMCSVAAVNTAAGCRASRPRYDCMTPENDENLTARNELRASSEKRWGG
jgi:hypothetical protein